MNRSTGTIGASPVCVVAGLFEHWPGNFNRDEKILRVLVISHDRWFLDRIATHILAFEGDSQLVIFNGNYQEYEDDKKRRLGEEGARPHRLRLKSLKA